MLRRNPSQPDPRTAPAPARGRTPSAGRRRKSAASGSPVRNVRATSAEGRSTRSAAVAARPSRSEQRRGHVVGTATIEHRLETTLTDNVYRTPRRSARLSTREPPAE